MFFECIEMESRTTPSPSRNRSGRKVIAEELELRDLPNGKPISCWWLTLPVLYYLTVIAGGVMASISVGDVVAAFDSNCVFFANITLKDLDALNNTKMLTRNNVEIISWGDMDSCLFPEYTSVACVMYAGILLVMVLQCGRGGGKSGFRGRGIAEPWRIVPVAFVFNLLFLILSSIVFGNIQNGFSTFCNGMSHKGSTKSLGNTSRCSEVLTYSFPWDKYSTNLYTEYVIATVGASMQLGGSLLAFLTIIVRCCLPADFVLYRRRKMGMTPHKQSTFDGEGRRSGASSQTPTILKTTAECHNETFLEEPADANLAVNDTDSIHSARSDVNLVSEGSRPSKSKSKTGRR